MEQVDILIAGGGIAGLTAAARLGRDGHSVLLADPAPLAPPAVGDLRTTAYLRPAMATLETAGAWSAMQERGAELRKMRIVDAGGVERAPRETVDFDGEETGAGSFGWNVPNVAARASLLDTISRLPNVRLMPEARIASCVTRMDHALLRTDTDAHKQ